jgi:cobalt-zinc-cadmium efflux system outer membrane protein
MRFRIALIAACAVHAAPGAAQGTPLSRGDVVQAALDRGARLGVARADTLLANAQLIAARAIPNPAVGASYSKSVPRFHFGFDVPLDFPALRQLRIRSAQVGAQAAQLRFQFVRAVIALDADTTYTRAIAAREHLALSHRNATDADSLLHMVERRRDAGDASDMDVELARVNAGQQTNLFVGDSLTLISTLLDLQAVIGMASERLEVRATDSLAMPGDAATPGRTLAEVAASMSVESAGLAARLQRRSIWALPTISFGFETSDPDAPGLLPTFGIGIGLPLFDRNRGAVAQAEAERARAVAELALAHVEAKDQIAHATRAREMALARVTRDRQLIASANRVAAMSLTAYREGAASLTNVLEAQRSARDVLANYVDDLADAWIATAELRVLALPPAAIQP